MAFINSSDDLLVKIVKVLVPFYLAVATTTTAEGKELPDEEVSTSETTIEDSSVITEESTEEESCEEKGCAIDYSYNIEETPVTPIEEQELPDEEIVIEQDEVVEDTPVPETETVTTSTQPESKTVTTSTQPVVYEETHTETYTESVTQEQETTSENLMLTDEEAIELVEATIEDMDDEGEVLGVMVDVGETSDPMLIYVGLSVLGMIGFFKIKRNLG